MSSAVRSSDPPTKAAISCEKFTVEADSPSGKTKKECPPTWTSVREIKSAFAAIGDSRTTSKARIVLFVLFIGFPQKNKLLLFTAIAVPDHCDLCNNKGIAVPSLVPSDPFPHAL